MNQLINQLSNQLIKQKKIMTPISQLRMRQPDCALSRITIRKGIWQRYQGNGTTEKWVTCRAKSGGTVAPVVVNRLMLGNRQWLGDVVLMMFLTSDVWVTA